MGIFSRRKHSGSTNRTPDRLIPVAVDPTSGTARVGDDAAPIFPLMMDDADPGDIVGHGIPPEQQPVRMILPSGLAVRFAFERPTHWDYVSHATAARLGLTAESLFDEALATLSRVDFFAESAGGRVRLEMPEGREDLAASLVLRASMLREHFGAQLDGDPVLAVAQRVAIHLCGSNDADSIDGLRELASALYSNGDAKPVSTALFRIDSSGIVQPF